MVGISDCMSKAMESTAKITLKYDHLCLFCVCMDFKFLGNGMGTHFIGGIVCLCMSMLNL